MHRFRKKSDAKRGEVPSPSAAGYQNAFTPTSPSTSSSSAHYQPYGRPVAHPYPSPIVTTHIVQHPPPEPPSLPPISDFRTSLILPDLSKRFTLLRANNGNAVNIDDLRFRFAEQRAKGAENQISEEEEAMLLDMLSRMRTQGAKLSKGGQNGMRSESSQQSLSSTEGETSTASSTVRQSGQSTTTLASPVNGYDQNPISASFSPTSGRSKRHSNQLFAGSQLRDLRTMRKTSNRTISSNRSVLSAAPSEVPSSIATSGSVANALIDFYSEDGARPTTPDNHSLTSPPASATSSPVSPLRKSSISSVEDVLAPLPSTSHLRVKKELTSNQLQRISMSLDDALKEMEEEAEDQVLVPRTSQVNGAAGVEKNAFALTTDDSIVSPVAVNASSVMSFTATTMTDDERPPSAGGYRSPSPYRAGGATSPVPRVPGYIPGMPRPVTPHRDTDNIEDVRSLSITPRAASSSISGLPISSPTPNLLRQAVSNSPTPYGSRPKSPHSSVRQGGRATPDERSSFNGSTASPGDHPPLSSHWRRPSSPLSTNSNAFQSLNGGSRPSTPSNVTWNMSARTSTSGSQQQPLQGVVRPLARSGTLSGHSRNGSISSIGENEWREKGENRVELGASPGASTSNVVLKSPTPVYRAADEEEARPKFLSNGSSLSASALAFIDFDPTIGTNPLPLSPTPPVHRTRSPAIREDMGSSRQKKSVASQLLTPPTSPFASKFGNDSNPLLLSSSHSNNSSRSSLVSVGSSYHSWEEENGAGGPFVPLPDGQEVAWHDISSSSNLSSNSRSHSRHSSKDEPESILRQYTGLSKADLLAIQGKLIDASQARAKTADVRASSTLRRRRPSAAQSIQSTGPPSRTTSPAPRIGAQWAASADSTVKANALLDSVIDSLRFPDGETSRSLDLEAPLQPPVIPALAPLSTSSPGRRNKDLTDILFGANEHDHDPLPSVIDSEPSPLGEGMPFYRFEKQPSESGHEPRPSSQLQADEPDLEPTRSMENHNEPVIPNFKHDENDQAELIRQVQERTQAAMAQLRKSPQQNRFPSLQPPGSRKKIQLQDISGPHLIQSSTSVDKLPDLAVSPRAQQYPEGQRTVKFSLSKRLRNTLKSKPGNLSGEEVTPWTLDNNSTTFSSSPHNSHTSLGAPKPAPHSPGSGSDHGGQYKGSNVSPPASAGPNLKTFMSRFRKKGQEPPAQKNFSMPPASNTGSRRSFQMHPSGALLRSGSVSQAEEHKPIVAPSMSRDVTERPNTAGSSPSHHPSQSSDPNALKQFYEAAQHLGLDQGALNDFLSRSGSLASKPSVKRVEPPVYDDEPVEERVHSPVIPEVFIDRQNAPDVSRSNTLRQSTSSPMSAVPRRVREVSTDSNARNTILRRTLIFPSGPNANGSSTELPLPSRKSTKSAKRSSALSFQSNRSLIDRVPTPPPNRAKRQSVEPSPPMPNMPSSPSWVNLGRPSLSRSPAPSPNDYSRYESFYEMYAGDQSGSTELDHPKTPEDGMPEVEDGQALEVIELANGETIWSIVNGLRADDTESFYQRRGSFESEFSMGQLGDGDSEQLFFKEHTRSGSKSSSNSNPRRRSHVAANRPETKVFYSSSAHIARLIENLSRSTEAATFNIKPKEVPNLGPDFGTNLPPHIPGHSHSSSLQTDSDMGFTVEERLDRMIDRVNSES